MENQGRTSLLRHSDCAAVQPATQFLTRLDAVLEAMANATAPSDLLVGASTAEALRVFARRAGLGLLAQNRAAEIRLRAERRLGEYLRNSDRNRGGRPNKKPVPDENGFEPTPLRELGITRRLSSRSQRLATIPPSTFDEWLQRTQEREIEITTRDLFLFHERQAAAAINRQHIVGGRVDDLVAFAQCGNRMGTLYIDPPWRFRGTLVPYETLDLGALSDLPVPSLAAERCHIHMWATGINNQFTAKEILESWGFRIVGDFVWVKPALGGRNYWRQSHEVMLTAVQAGHDDRFDEHGLRSWIEAPRGRHSEKPEVVRKMIERASPPPRLELFARTIAAGWFAWGHQIAQPLSKQVAQGPNRLT